MEINPAEKNSKLNKELSNNEEVSLKIKIFNFFFFVLRKKDINIFLCGFLLILETLQLISYAFTTPHSEIWGIKEKTMDLIQLIIGAPRITPLMRFIKYDYFIVIYAILLGYIFIHMLLVTMIIKFNKTQSKFYQIGVAFTRYFTTPLTIFFYIPISELVLLPLKCKNDKVDIVKDPIKCWNSIHYLYVVLSIIFAIAFFIFIFFNGVFYFEPFNSKKTTAKLDSTSDLFLYFCKMISVIRFILIKNQYISIVLMVLLSVFNLKRGIENPTYNNYGLECILSIRNASFFWTFFILLIAKLAQNSKINGLIFLLLFGYPLIIVVSIIYYKNKSQSFMITTSNFNDASEFLSRIKYMIKLIESFFSKNKNGKASKNSSCKKNEILLKGLISIHEEGCITEECPLKKFEENTNNFSAQKTCLLHYMNNLFMEGIKKFPNSRLLLMIFVQFNYDKKYNLNAAKTYLTKLEKQKNTLTEDYIIYSIKQNIMSCNNKPNLGINDNEEMLRIEDTIEQKYRRLKFLVETTVKLYSEFWGILAANLTNNLNINKLFLIGNKLNKFLNEINSLWENDLKNKKIDLENQSTAQLYAYFLREILKNKKRSDEITKKLNEEQHFESRKADSDKFDIDNLDIILENQDHIIYCRTNEKGECDIIQCSNSIVYLLGFTKQELIGKNIEVLMPTAFTQDHGKKLSATIKQMKNSSTSHKDNYRTGDKKQIFILPKTKVGFLIPINARFTLFNDDDFSNTYIIKAKFEAKDTKSIYAFYVLTDSFFSVDSISSSAINLGLSMDLLKKYVIHMEHLVRTEGTVDKISLSDKWQEFEEDPKKITWVFPDKIYPKNDSQRKSEENIEELIKQSTTKEYMLLISKMKYSEEETLGYCFKFSKTDDKKNSFELGKLKTSNSRAIMFDLLRLNYVRTIIVNQKSPGYHDTRPITNKINSLVYNKENSDVNQKVEKKKKKKNANANSTNKEGGTNTGSDNEGSDDYEEEKKQEVLLTKEKIAELQTRSSEEIKAFISELPYYGSEVSLEKHRPNKERYPVGKQTEPEIKISINQFENRIKERLKAHPDKSNKSKQVDEENNQTLNNYVNASNADSTIASEFSSDSSASLSNIFNEKSVTYIQFFSFGFFVILCFIISIEFALSLTKINDSFARVGYMDKGFEILNSLMYTKFFLTEAVLAGYNDYTPIYNYSEKYESASDYASEMKEEMSTCREKFSNTYSHFSNATVSFSKEYNIYISNTSFSIATLSNNAKSIQNQPFSTAMSNIHTSIFYVSTVTDSESVLYMDNTNVYELMVNLLNDYLMKWRDVALILVKDVLTNAKNNNSIAFIFGFSFLISIVALFVVWKLINRFIDDREKPIDLFLTIKKKRFTELKDQSDSFTNKLLNKFFGNEDAEEESVVEYTNNIKPDDINIIKFKTKNEYKQSIRTSKEYLVNYIKLVIFFVVIEAYLVFKYCYNKSGFKSINSFTRVFNITHYSQSDIILSLNVAKSFFYDPYIPIYSENLTSYNNGNDSETFKNNSEIFRKTFVDLSDSFQNLLVTTYGTDSFLKGGYISKFFEWLNKDIKDMVKDNDYKNYMNDDYYLGTLEYGFKATIARYFGLLRYIGTTYLKHENSTNGNSTVLLKSSNSTKLSKFICMEEFIEINSIVKDVISSWYENLLKKINERFDSYINKLKVVNISTFIVVIVCVVLLYCLGWKSYEENLKDLLKTSVELINLIPEEIKFQIVQKLNDEDNKQE